MSICPDPKNNCDGFYQAYMSKNYGLVYPGQDFNTGIGNQIAISYSSSPSGGSSIRVIGDDKDTAKGATVQEAIEAFNTKQETVYEATFCKTLGEIRGGVQACLEWNKTPTRGVFVLLSEISWAYCNGVLLPDVRPFECPDEPNEDDPCTTFFNPDGTCNCCQIAAEVVKILS